MFRVYVPGKGQFPALDRAHAPYCDFFWCLGAEPLVSSFGGKAISKKEKREMLPLSSQTSMRSRWRGGACARWVLGGGRRHRGSGVMHIQRGHQFFGDPEFFFLPLQLQHSPLALVMIELASRHAIAKVHEVRSSYCTFATDSPSHVPMLGTTTVG